MMISSTGTIDDNDDIISSGGERIQQWWYNLQWGREDTVIINRRYNDETDKDEMIKVDIIVESRYKCGSWLDYDRQLISRLWTRVPRSSNKVLKFKELRKVNQSSEKLCSVKF